MQRASSEVLLSQRMQPKSKLTPAEQDKFFQRLAAPRRAEQNAQHLESGVFDGPDTESSSTKSQVRPRSASQQAAACAYLAAPKTRGKRPCSPPKPCVTDSA